MTEAGERDSVQDQLCARIEELEKEKLELNEQLDELQKERDALAAHVERCQKFLEDMHMMPTDWTIMESQRIHADKPETSLARLKAEWDKAELQPVWETLIKVADLLGIDAEEARSLPGKPSDVYAAYLARLKAQWMEEAVVEFGFRYGPETEVRADSQRVANKIRQCDEGGET